ncbi:MAG: UbiD family decarboxylase [Chloroflexi bacterium]|nr:UbiD family decarboxylase [Chloroflexota bacterium]
MSVPNDMREFMGLLEQKGELIRIRSEVDPHNFDIPAMIRHSEDGANKALLFERVKGYDMPVVANLYGSVYRCALGCSVEPTAKDVEQYRRDPHGSLGGLGGRSEDVHEGFAMTAEQRAMVIVLRQALLEAERLAAQGAQTARVAPAGHCQEVIIKQDIDLLATLPIPTLCEKDAGPFITGGCSVMRDPDTGVLDIGVRRHQVGGDYGKNRMGAQIIETTDGGKIMKKYEERSQPCEVALCLGVDPITMLMGCYNSTHFQWKKPCSEYDMVGAMMGKPLDLVKCQTVDLEVPASSEIVIEGVIPPGQRIVEGPMAEFTDLYVGGDPWPFIEVTAITHRKNPMMQVLLSGRAKEHCILGMLATSLGTEQRILMRARQSFPTVKDVAIYGGSENFHIVASLKKRFEGEDKLLLYHLLATTFHRYITIVDDDIEPHNMEMVEWARVTRAGANSDDFIIFPKVHTWEKDPEVDEAKRSTRLGVLATLPFGEKHFRSGPPEEALARTRALFMKESANR